jgi:hypothetical protein
MVWLLTACVSAFGMQLMMANIGGWLGSLAIQTRHFDAPLINGSAARSPAAFHIINHTYTAPCALSHRHSHTAHTHARIADHLFSFRVRCLIASHANDSSSKVDVWHFNGRHTWRHSATAARSVNVCDARVTPNVISFVLSLKTPAMVMDQFGNSFDKLARNVMRLSPWAMLMSLMHAIMKLSREVSTRGDLKTI